MLPFAFLGSNGLKWVWERKRERKTSLSVRLGACGGPSLSAGNSQLCHFHWSWQTRSSSAGGRWVGIGMLRRGEKLTAASSDLHNKIKISPVAFSCLLVAVVEWVTLGTASLKGLPGPSGPQRALGSNVQLNWWDQFIRIKTPSTSKAAWGWGQSLSFRSQSKISCQEEIYAAFFHSFDYVTGGKDFFRQHQNIQLWKKNFFEASFLPAVSFRNDCSKGLKGDTSDFLSLGGALQTLCVCLTSFSCDPPPDSWPNLFPCSWSFNSTFNYLFWCPYEGFFFFFFGFFWTHKRHPSLRRA